MEPGNCVGAAGDKLEVYQLCVDEGNMDAVKELTIIIADV